MDNIALAALHVAADAIRTLEGVSEATADNDNNSGEVLFSLANGEAYSLKLSQTESAPTHYPQGHTGRNIAFS